MIDIRGPRPILRNLSRTPSDWSKHVLSLTATKSLSANPGTFDVTLVPAPGQDVPEVTSIRMQSVLYSMFKAMDVVHLGMHWRNPETQKTENNIFMWGIIDNVFKVKQQMGTNVTRGVRIRGQDATKLFSKDEVVYAPLQVADPDLLKIFGPRANFLDYQRGYIDSDDPSSIFLQGDVVTALWWILRNIPATDVQLEGPNGDPMAIQNIIMVNKTGRHNLLAFAKDIIHEPTLTKFSGTIMNYMRSVIDPDMYELWFDTVPDPEADKGAGSAYPILICRPKPFDFSWDWDSKGTPLKEGNQKAGITAGGGGGEELPQIIDVNLPFWDDLVSPTSENVTINEDDILTKNIGVSDYEVYTFYNMMASKDPIAGMLFGAFGYYLPLIDIQMAKVYGVRALLGQSKMFGGSYADKRNAVEAAAKRLSEEPLDVNGIIDWGIASATAVINEAQSIDDFAMTKRDMIWRWNRYNHMMMSGPITIKGRPVSVGGKAILPDEETKGFRYLTAPAGTPSLSPVPAMPSLDSNFTTRKGIESYITQWTQNYTFGTPWQTSMALTRGHNSDEIKAYALQRNFNKPVSLNVNRIISIEKDIFGTE